MTQEELDALMAEGFEESEEALTTEESVSEAPEAIEGGSEDEETATDTEKVEAWPPPPPTDDHKIVNQLDTVTRDSEKKATEIFDKLEEISAHTMEIESLVDSQQELLKKHHSLFTKLHQSFPDAHSFQEALSESEEILEKIDRIREKAQTSGDEIMMIMDIMQYQDIHRQKIERVINVMRALLRYMNSMFESQIDDKDRVSSAVHIHGDKENGELVSNEDIEALIANFGG